MSQGEKKYAIMVMGLWANLEFRSQTFGYVEYLGAHQAHVSIKYD